MNTNTGVEAIPKEVALRLCAEIREGNRRKRFTFAAMKHLHYAHHQSP